MQPYKAIMEERSDHMKLERLNENQIRCTLNKSDLEQRQLRLSELAYGSAKARELFRDMIQQASAELGFEAENIPLMIEAIPISSDCLILVVTKVEDQDELDSRLSHFSKLADILNEIPLDDDLLSEAYNTEDDEDGILDGFQTEADDGSSLDPLGLIAPFTQALARAKKLAADKGEAPPEPAPETELFIFRDLDSVISLSAVLVPFYQGGSTLYKDEELSQYYLFLNRNDSSAEYFDRACIIASDYGVRIPGSYASAAYCTEHCLLMRKDSALEYLNQLN